MRLLHGLNNEADGRVLAPAEVLHTLIDGPGIQQDGVPYEWVADDVFAP
jgi:hypothetical protein